MKPGFDPEYNALIHGDFAVMVRFAISNIKESRFDLKIPFNMFRMPDQARHYVLGTFYRRKD